MYMVTRYQLHIRTNTLKTKWHYYNQATIHLRPKDGYVMTWHTYWLNITLTLTIMRNATSSDRIYIKYVVSHHSCFYESWFFIWFWRLMFHFVLNIFTCFCIHIYLKIFTIIFKRSLKSFFVGLKIAYT